MTMPPMAGGLPLCLKNAAQLDGDTVQAFQTELSRILTSSGWSGVWSPCSSGVLAITLRRDPPESEPSALGGIRTSDGRLLPEIELFVSPTAQIVGTRLPAVLGRALARVATHELGHWLNQGPAHTSRGYMMERLSAAHLMAPDHGFFRLPPLE